MGPKERYETDPAYKLAVDIMSTIYARMKLSPEEMRVAAMLAFVKYCEKYKKGTKE